MDFQLLRTLVMLSGDIAIVMVGSCKYSNITIFSLHPVKIITSGEGGIASIMMKNFLIN